MNFAEEALQFECEGALLLGVLGRPEAPCGTGVLIVVGGPQYRAGSHRHFVGIARRMAAAGYPVLRFDYRGMGDSAGPARQFEGVQADIDAAIAALQRAVPGVRRVVLWGLCDGASAALMQVVRAEADRQIAGLCLLNPWVRSAETLARTHVRHYYLARLKQREFWLKLARGQVAWQAFKGLLGNVRTAAGRPGAAEGAGPDEHFVARMARAWRRFPGPVLLVLSAEDITANEFREALRDERAWARPNGPRALTQVLVDGADHTFSDPHCRQTCDDAVLSWLQTLDRPSRGALPQRAVVEESRAQ